MICPRSNIPCFLDECRAACAFPNPPDGGLPSGSAPPAYAVGQEFLVGNVARGNDFSAAPAEIGRILGVAETAFRRTVAEARQAGYAITFAPIQLMSRHRSVLRANAPALMPEKHWHVRVSAAIATVTPVKRENAA